MYPLDPETRRNLRYAALPGKAATAFAVLLLCLFAGVLATAVIAYVYGAVVRNFFGGF
jgi:hypothetical protein